MSKTGKAGRTPFKGAPAFRVKSLVYERRAVAFFDVLGWRSKISRAADDSEKIAELSNLLRLFSMYAEESAPKSKGARHITTFSDNVVISEEPSERRLAMFLVRAGVMQLLAAYQGFLIRGGVTVGKVVHDSRLVFGPGLIKAYELESTVAVYPRVVVDDAVASEFSKTPFGLLVEEDGVKFVDPFTVPFLEYVIGTGEIMRLRAGMERQPTLLEYEAVKALWLITEDLKEEMQRTVVEREWKKLAWLYDRIMQKSLEQGDKSSREFRRTVLHI